MMPAFTLHDFIRESNRIEGIQRSPTAAEVSATGNFCARTLLTVGAVVDLVAVFQPDAKPRFVRGLDVRVGDHYPMPGGPEVQAKFIALIDKLNEWLHSPYETHCEYETLHPFTDGNGRSGRAIWLWAIGGIIHAPLGFLHHFYYQSLSAYRTPSQAEGEKP